MMDSRSSRLASLAALVLVLLWWSTALFTVDQTERAIVTRFGRPLDGVAEPGLHTKLPWPIDAVVRVDARLLVFDNEPVEMLTADKKNILLDSFICWRIADPLRFTQTVKTRPEAEARLVDIAASELGAAVGREPMESFISVTPGVVKLSAIAARVTRAVDAVARRSFGIEVLDLRLNGLFLPAQNRASVIDRMRAERARIATKYRSEGEEEALKIKAQTSVERDQILAAARADAESLRGTGEAQAMRLLSEAYADDPAFYRFLRSLQAAEAIVDDKTTIFLPSDSPLLRALQGPDGRR
jgi:modulator of FtsH protease HflC